MTKWGITTKSGCNKWIRPNIRQDALQQSSAICIQSAVRNRKALNETIARATKKSTQNTAAVTIQNAVRNHNALNEAISRATRKTELNDAASTIQNAIKSKKAPAELKQNKNLKAISNAVVEGMQIQIRKQQEHYINAG